MVRPSLLSDSVRGGGSDDKLGVVSGRYAFRCGGVAVWYGRASVPLRLEPHFLEKIDKSEGEIPTLLSSYRVLRILLEFLELLPRPDTKYTEPGRNQRTEKSLARRF